MVQQVNEHMAEGHGNEEARIWKILRILGWSGAAIIMLIALAAKLFTDEMGWTFSDFVVAAIILGATGLAFEFAIRRSNDNAYRTGILLALAAGFLLIWSNAAVGFIGAGANAANILYAAMLAVPVIGSMVTGLRPKGMFTTMIVTAIVQVAITAFAFASDLVREKETALTLAVNGIFIALWIGSALLFRQAAQRIDASGTEMRRSQNLTRESRIHFLLSILLILIGAILAVAMITTESEPGALPLLLVLLGMGWFAISLFRANTSGKK